MPTKERARSTQLSGDHGSLGREIGERLSGQDDDVGALAAAQPIQQPQRRREIGIDARAACRLDIARQGCEPRPSGPASRARERHFPSEAFPASI